MDEQRACLCELDWYTGVILLSPRCCQNHACDLNAMRRGMVAFAWWGPREKDQTTLEYHLEVFSGEDWGFTMPVKIVRGT